MLPKITTPLHQKSMLNRRQLLAASTGAALLPRLAWALDANNPYRENIGIQLYSLRDPIGDDVMTTLGVVAEMGYKQVEPYGFPNCDAILDAARAHGLPVHSSHFDSGPVLHGKDDAPLKRILDKANTVGLSHLVIPYLGGEMRRSLDDYKRIAERCNIAAEQAKSAGIQMSYHNHAFEFKPFDGGRRGYDVLIDEFSADMKFEVDVFWVQAAGVDPVSLMEKLSGRITQLHLKDLAADVPIPTYDGMPKEAFKEIGSGVVAIEKIMEKASSTGIQHCHVEQDHSPHPIDSVRQSIGVIAKM